MNSNKLFQILNDKILTDLELTLDDGINQITMNVHKLILYLSSSYFEKLLTRFKEKDLNKITINVPMFPSETSLCEAHVVRSFR